MLWLRLPEVMRHGRFWAEEGHVYFANAYALPWRQALFSRDLGYLNFPATAATLLARHLVSLENAPHVTTVVALALQSLPAILLLTARDAWLGKPHVIAAALLLVAAPVSGDEVWLNTINSQVHIALASALCLGLDIPAGAGAWARVVLLFAAPLCSPVTIVLGPMILARAAWERDRARLIQAAAILAGTAIMLTVFYRPMPQRGHLMGPSVLAAVLASRHLALPLLGQELAGVIAADLRESLADAHRPAVAFLAVAIAGCGLATAVVLRRSATIAWMLAAGVAVGALSYHGALDSGLKLVSVDGDMRYAFVATILVGLCVLAVAATGADRLGAIAWVFTAWLLATGVLQTILPHSLVYATGPRWRDEVAHWRADPSHALAIWPSGWSVRLDRGATGR